MGGDKGKGAEDGNGFRREVEGTSGRTGRIYSLGDKAPAVPSCLAPYLSPFLYPIRLSRLAFPIADMVPGTHCSLFFLYIDTPPFLPSRNKRLSLFEFRWTIIEEGEI